MSVHFKNVFPGRKEMSDRSTLIEVVGPSGKISKVLVKKKKDIESATGARIIIVEEIYDEKKFLIIDFEVDGFAHVFFLELEENVIHVPYHSSQEKANRAVLLALEILSFIDLFGVKVQEVKTPEHLLKAYEEGEARRRASC